MKKIIFIALLLTVSIVLVAQYKKHTVVKGDCLWDIAGFYYNDPFLWPVIYEANKDSIADPHWIYPGEVFIIPNVPEEQVSTPPVQEGIVMEVKGTKSKIEKETLITRSRRAEEELEEAEETELFSVVQAADYAFTRKAALLAGFITKDRSLEIGTISKLVKNLPDLKGSATIMGDEVELNKGSSDGIKEGDIYVIFKWDKGVRRYGQIVRIKGILKILEAGENISTANIIESYEKIEKGDHIMKYTAPEVVTGKPQPVTEEITGKIIAFKNEDPIIKPFSVVYIEPGSGSVKLGDVFLIYKKGPGDLITPLGKIQIVDVREETASGYITSIMGQTKISLGNKIRLVGRIGG
jgi:hypothetical protein